MPDVMTPGAPEEKPVPIAEFEGFGECPLFAEEVKISLYPDEILIAALFDQIAVPYGEIAAIGFENYRVNLTTASGPVTFSRMGQEAEWLYDKLTMAYHDAVLRALLVEGEHQFEAAGRFRMEEGREIREEQGLVRLYPDCLVLLPPNENARRLPLCFLTGMEKGDFSRTLILATGERYTLSYMGRELENLDRLLTANVRALREETMNWHRAIAPAMSPMQGAAAAKLMPLGAAAQLSALTASAAPLAEALKGKIRESRMAGSYPWLERFAGEGGIAVGGKPAPEKEEEDPAAVLAEPTEPAEGEEAPAEPPPILWVTALSQAKGIAAVELALADNEAAATYLYRIEGEPEGFARLLHRGLEATGFERSPILLTEEKLKQPENLPTAMLIRRTPALQRMRACFAGRAIHSSEERWKRDIEKCCAPAAPAAQAPGGKARFCTNCGGKLNPGARFCGQCGSPVIL